MKYFCLFIIFMTFTMCHFDEKNIVTKKENQEIDSVLITYYCGIIDSDVAIKCEKIEAIQVQHNKNNYSAPIQIIDTFIVNENVLKRIASLVKKKEIINEYDEDARLYASIIYKDKSKENICLGMNTPSVLVNGKATRIENELVYLLRNYSGYYKWIDSLYFSLFIELQDTTFKR